MSNNAIKIAIAGLPSKTHNYEAFCHLLDLTPVSSLNPSDYADCAALILPGGGDIDPELYGQSNCGSMGIDRNLDLLQIQALEYFLHAGKPILGICRGMQLLNVYFGGTLIQDLPNAQNHKASEGDALHSAHITEDCILSYLYGYIFPVNSSHHQAVDRLGSDLKIIQYAADGVAEAIQHKNKPILGVQWHPERFKAVQTDTALAKIRRLIPHYLSPQDVR